MSPARVIKWAIRKESGKSISFCPPIIFFLLCLGLVIATNKYIFFKASFNLDESSTIFINFLTKWPNLTEGIIFLCSVAIIFTISAIVLIFVSGRAPTKERISNNVKFLLYYWSIIIFGFFIIFCLSILFGVDDPAYSWPVLFIFLLIIAVTLVFSNALREITERKWILSFITILLSQWLIPLTIFFSVPKDFSFRWTMDRKFQEADFVGVVKVEGIEKLDEPILLDAKRTYTLESIAIGVVEDIWKGKCESELLKISLPIPFRGREFNINKDRRYLVFFESYNDKNNRYIYVPIDGSPVSFYEISEDEYETLIPLGHKKNLPSELQLIENESIPLEKAKSKLIGLHVK